jgi:pyruvate-formate lyase-activating enzyme
MPSCLLAASHRIQDVASPAAIAEAAVRSGVISNKTLVSCLRYSSDSASEIEGESAWVMDRLGADVPLHFTAFHPDWKLTDRPPTPPRTLRLARRIAMNAGIRYVYTGNIHDPAGQATHY